MKTLPAKLAALLLLLPSAAIAQTTDTDALAFLKKHAPEVHGEIVKLKASDPADYRSAMDDAQKAAADYAKLETSGDAASAAAYLKMYAIDFDAIGVADEIVTSKDTAEKERLTKKLRELISSSFDQWAIVEQARIRRLEKELAALQADLQTSLRDREKVIASDTAKLLEEAGNYLATKKK